MSITRLKQARQMRKGGGVMGSNNGSMLVAPTADGSRPGYYGADAGFGDDDYKDEQQSFEQESQDRVDRGGSGGGTEEQFRAARVTQDTVGQERKIAADRAKVQAAKTAEAKRVQDILDAHRGKEPVAYSYGPKIKDYKKNYFTGPNKFSTATKMRQLALKNLIDKKMGNKSTMPSIFEMGNFFNPSMVDQDYTYNSGITTDMMGVDLQDYSDMGKYGLTGKNMTDIDRMNKALDTGRETGEITQQQFEDAFNNQNINTSGGGGQTILPYPYNVQQPEEEEVEPAPYNQFTYDSNAFGPGGKSRDVTDPRGYAADGGIMGTRARRAFGGIMDRVTGRKAYGLGSIFKSVKKAASKVLKSDIGKAALLYAGGVYLGGGNIFSPSAYNPANFLGSKTSGGYFANMGGGLSNLGKKIGFNKLSADAGFGEKAMKFGKNLLLGYGLTKTKLGEVKPNETSFSDRGSPLLNSQGVEGSAAIKDEIQEAYAAGDSEKIAQLQKYYNYMLPVEGAVQEIGLPSSAQRLPYQEFGSAGYRTTVATGGRIGFNSGGSPIKLLDGTVVQIPSGAFGKEGLKDIIYSSSKGDLTKDEIVPLLVPAGASYNMGGRINKAEGGLMDLGGMEKDYRKDGGFVPIGEYEKKDDVPARLSVNEFVFTADAVRGAGEGDIDKGAEVMENMMKNLENGGTVSEESQGNTGAQDMFSVSQRLGEVI